MVPGASWVVPLRVIAMAVTRRGTRGRIATSVQGRRPRCVQKMGKGKGKKGKGEKRMLLSRPANLDAEEGLGRWPWFMQ